MADTPAKKSKARTWIQIAASAPQHPKYERINPTGEVMVEVPIEMAAFALHTAATGRSREFLTDGEITLAGLTKAWPTLDRDVLKRLVSLMTRESSLLLDDLGEGNYKIHDYEDYQQTKEEVEAIHEARSAAGRKGGRGNKADDSNPDDTRGKQTGSKTKANRKHSTGQDSTEDNPPKSPLPGTERVFISEEDLANLYAKHGKRLVDDKIEQLDANLIDGSKKSKNHKATVDYWCKQQKKRDKSKTGESPYKCGNCQDHGTVIDFNNPDHPDGVKITCPVCNGGEK